MRAEAKFANPDDAQMTITLRGTLKEFTDLSSAMLGDSALPYWQTRALVDAISNAAWKLRGAVSVDCDTDGSPKGTDPKGLDGEAATAGAEGIAQPLPEEPSHD